MKDKPQPSLEQLQWYLRKDRFKKKMHDNTIQCIKNLIKSNKYYDGIKEDKAFFFGVEFDDVGEPIINSGEVEAFRVGLTLTGTASIQKVIILLFC